MEFNNRRIRELIKLYEREDKMNSPYCDKYFTKSKEVLKEAGLNPIVSYRIFTRFDGVAALGPMRFLIKVFYPGACINILPTGTAFKAGETIATVTGEVQELLELETMWLQWVALPCYCAYEARRIVEVAGDKALMDFAARHLFDPTSVALASFGAQIGGIKACSTDVGANASDWLKSTAINYRYIAEDMEDDIKMFQGQDWLNRGIGTTPHALLAIFKGDYEAMANAYLVRYPEDDFVALIDYNNKEIDDSLLLLKHIGKKLYGVRTDTCGENFAQVQPTVNGQQGNLAMGSGVIPYAVMSLRKHLNEADGQHVKIFVSSGFGVRKTEDFMTTCKDSFDGIGTGSFIPKGPTATADIYEVDGKPECKVGREWGYKANEEFFTRL